MYLCFNGGDYLDVHISVNGQKLKTETDLAFISGTQEFIRFVFQLPEDWKAFIPDLHAQFVQDENTYTPELDENYSVYLPSEIQPGTCSLMLYGTGDPAIATSNFLTLTIGESIFRAW